MKTQILDNPSQAIIATIEQEISNEPISSITTTDAATGEGIYTVSYIAATIDEEPAGIAVTRSAGPSVVELHKLIVIERFRKTGLGTKLFQRVAERCRHEGVESLMIQPTNGSEEFWNKTLDGFTFCVYENNGVIDVTL